MRTPCLTPITRASLLATASQHSRWFACLVAGASAFSAAPVFAVDWNGAGPDWNNPANWTPAGVPSGANAVINVTAPSIATINATISVTPVDIIIGDGATGQLDHLAGDAGTGPGNWMFAGRNGGTGVYNLGDPEDGDGTYSGLATGTGNLNVGGRLYVGGNAGTGSTGTVNVNTAGTLAIGAHLEIATNSSTGTFNLDAGSVTVGDWMEVGNGGGSTGYLNMSGGTITKGGNNGFIIGANGATGVATVTGGTIVTTSGGNGQFRVGNNSGSNGTLYFSDASLSVSNEIWIGNNTGAGGTGTLLMSGGTWTKTGVSNFIIGASGNGTMEMSGGIVDVAPSTTADRGITWIGEQNNCTGALTLSGSSEFRTARFTLGVTGGTTGTLDLDGGTARTGQITGGGGTSTVNFNGTQIVATANQANFVANLTGAVVEAGGLKVDTNGFNVTIPQGLTAGTPSGGVVKTGSGSLTLSGLNSYTGDHQVNAGRLAVTSDSTGGGSFTVADAATLGVIQTSDINSLNAANVTLGSSAATALDIDLGDIAGNPEAAPLNVTGTLTLNGEVTVNLADLRPAVGVVPLVAYQGAAAGGGSYTLGSLPNGVVVSAAGIIDDPDYYGAGQGLVYVEVESVSLPSWTGSDSSVWDTTTENWFDLVSYLDSTYSDPAPVLFDDFAEETAQDITLDETVAPSSVVFENSTLVFSLSGTGKITGGTGLTKKGTSSVTVSTANDYLGVTSVSGGTLEAISLADGGAPSSIGASSSDPGNLVLNGGTLSYTGAPVTIDRGLTVAASGSTIAVADALTLAGPIVTAGGDLTKAGAGNLILANDGPSVIGAVSPGCKVQEGTLTLSGAGAQAITVIGEMQVANTPDVSADLVLENSSLTTTNFLAIGRGNGDNGVCHLTATDSTLLTANFSTGYNNGLANNASEQFVVLNDTVWTNTGVTYLAESTGSLATMTLNGTSQYNAAGTILVGRFGGTDATLTLADDSSVTKTAGYLGIGAGGTGVLNVQGNASFTSNVDDFNVGDGGTGTIHLGGNGEVNASQVYVGKGATGIGLIDQTGGSFESSTFVTVGRFTGGNGEVKVSGGTFTQNGAAQTLLLGQEGNGSLWVSGTGEVLVNGTALQLGTAGTSSGTVHLDGGTLTVRQVIQGAEGNSEFYFNGGVLKANTGAAFNFLAGLDAAYVNGGGAVIDSNGQTIAIGQNLVDSGAAGGLTKTGAGTLLLNGSNSYTGTTTVAAGTLGGTGLIAGPLAVPAGSTIAPGASAGTFTAGATTIDGTYACEIDGATADKLVVNGALVINPGAVLDFDVLAAPTVPMLVIASYGGLSGTFTVQDLPDGYEVDYHYNNGVNSNNIALVSTAGTPFDSWIASHFPGETDPLVIGAGADPDKDGSPNFLEFALGGSPGDAADGPKAFQFAADGGDAGSEKELLMTIAVRGNPTFSADPQPTATVDGYTYAVAGSLDLGTFASPVTAEASAVVPPSPDDLPPAGYVWRTFSLDGSNNLPGKGFMRVAVEQAP
ncbi:beta strand repeat-containing protein [Luteolibacter marinus]|uniref:beta strand repeat-containing protein n=1 Tax=Luteolibacter marinus TaxID=2776705 RepID=UPI0018690AB2|nr:autotransporter-associated beta strand repeat-containing protein [Luteolibacter marinus]